MTIRIDNDTALRIAELTLQIERVKTTIADVRNQREKLNARLQELEVEQNGLGLERRAIATALLEVEKRGL